MERLASVQGYIGNWFRSNIGRVGIVSEFVNFVKDLQQTDAAEYRTLGRDHVYISSMRSRMKCWFMTKTTFQKLATKLNGYDGPSGIIINSAFWRAFGGAKIPPHLSTRPHRVSIERGAWQFGQPIIQGTKLALYYAQRIDSLHGAVNNEGKVIRHFTYNHASCVHEIERDEVDKHSPQKQTMRGRNVSTRASSNMG